MITVLVLTVLLSMDISQSIAAAETSLEAIVPDGGTIRQQGERLDIYDRSSKRVGYGYVRLDGTIELFNQDGTRRATIQKGTAGDLRVTVPKRNK